MGELRVVAPYTVIHPLADAALTRHAPQAERIEVTGSFGYWELLCQLWGDRKAFMIVEQDIEIHGEAITAFENCTEDWCLFPYPGPPVNGWSQDPESNLVRSLGCTRFSRRLIKNYPEALSAMEPGERAWPALDMHVYRALTRLGCFTHVHNPPVQHHHVYGGVCTCLTTHPPYSIDANGRYARRN